MNLWRWSWNMECPVGVSQGCISPQTCACFVVYASLHNTSLLHLLPDFLSPSVHSVWCRHLLSPYHPPHWPTALKHVQRLVYVCRSIILPSARWPEESHTNYYKMYGLIIKSSTQLTIIKSTNPPHENSKTFAANGKLRGEILQ